MKNSKVNTYFEEVQKHEKLDENDRENVTKNDHFWSKYVKSQTKSELKTYKFLMKNYRFQSEKHEKLVENW